MQRLAELRRACRGGGWKGHLRARRIRWKRFAVGNVYVLFKCLDVDGGDGHKTIELEELLSSCKRSPSMMDFTCVHLHRMGS